MRFERLYGKGPLHLLASLATFAIAGYGIGRILELSAALEILVWLGLAALAHDLLVLPLYSALGLVASRVVPSYREVPALNYLRVPAVISGLLFVVFFPLILGLSGGRYERATGLELDGYLGRWLLITGVLFGLSALAYAVRVRKTAQ